jgi:ATP-binding cassette subfamily B protein
LHALRLAYATTHAAGGRLLRVIGLLQLLSSVFLVVQLLMARNLIAQLTTPNASVRDMTWRVAVLLVAFGVTAASTAVVAVLQRLLAERVTRDSVGTVLDAATRTELLDFETPELHNRLQRALMNAGTRPTQMTFGLLAALSALAMFAAIGITVLVLSPLLFFIAVIVAVPLALIAMTSSKAFFEFAVRQTASDRRRLYLQILLTARDWAKEVKAYNLGAAMLERWRHLYDQRLEDLTEVLGSRARRSLLGVLASVVSLGAALFILLWMLTTHRISLAAGATVAAGLLLMSRQVQSLSVAIANIYETALYMEDYRYFVQQNAASEPASTPSSQAASNFESLTLRDVSFTYQSSPRPAVSHVSLDIRPGQIVALVGENGSGKSTLAKLIAGLYPASSGQLLWNGQPYEDLPTDVIRNDIGVLFQDFIKFQMSIAENIRMGRIERSDISPSDIADAAATAGASQFIEALNDGYNTELGPEFVGGHELSGGQWQRLALARAAFRGASLVVLDEPTAALDPLAEEQLFNSTRRIFEGQTVLLISHRFSSVRLADCIYVLHEGRIIESGTHDELMVGETHYSDMYRAQHAALLGPVPKQP